MSINKNNSNLKKGDKTKFSKDTEELEFSYFAERSIK